MKYFLQKSTNTNNPNKYTKIKQTMFSLTGGEEGRGGCSIIEKNEAGVGGGQNSNK